METYINGADKERELFKVLLSALDDLERYSASFEDNPQPKLATTIESVLTAYKAYSLHCIQHMEM